MRETDSAEPRQRHRAPCIPQAPWAVQETAALLWWWGVGMCRSNQRPPPPHKSQGRKEQIFSVWPLSLWSGWEEEAVGLSVGSWFRHSARQRRSWAHSLSISRRSYPPESSVTQQKEHRFSGQTVLDSIPGLAV